VRDFNKKNHIEFSASVTVRSINNTQGTSLRKNKIVYTSKNPLVNELTIDDCALVAEKNALFGWNVPWINSNKAIQIPNGFAVTAEAYRYCWTGRCLASTTSGTGWPKSEDVADLARRGLKHGRSIYAAPFPADLGRPDTQAYAQLNQQYGDDMSVAVRSSATLKIYPPPALPDNRTLP